jgi:hypothetical protein
MEYLNINKSGNRKLMNTENVRFLIWNLPAQITCPFATEHCKKSCYAKKAERLYPQVLPSRMKNLEDSRRADFVDKMIATILHTISGRAYKGKKIIFRIHESGDFYSLEYTAKWLEIIRRLAWVENLKFEVYTKSIKFLHDLGWREEDYPNFEVMASVWDDTSAENLHLIEIHNMRIYTAFTLEEFAKQIGYTVCECADCANCGKCVNREIRKLACKIH